MIGPTTVTEDGTAKLCFGSDSALDGNELFCHDGSSLRQRTNIQGRPPDFGETVDFGDLVFYDGAFYFEAPEDRYDTQLWRYDGTSASQVTDIEDGASPENMTVYDGTLYFQADGPDGGRELWSYDGSTASRVADINDGRSDSNPAELTVYDGTLYFRAFGEDGRELWSYDGADTSQVADLYTGTCTVRGVDEPCSSNPSGLTVHDGVLYFSARDGSDGRELWQYDGSEVTQVKDINSGSEGSDPASLTAYDGALYFRANDGSTGSELWQYDGSEVSQVKDINSGSEGSTPVFLTVSDGVLYFEAGDGTNGRGFWSYDGTSVSLVEPLPVSGLVDYEGTLYFQSPLGLKRYDGSSMESLRNNAFVRPEEKVVYDGMIYFVMETDSTGKELWRYDGSSVSQAADINPGEGSSNPKYLTAYDGTLYFQADGGEDGKEFWSYDGSSATQVENIWDTSFGNSSSPEHLTVYDGTLYFAAEARDGIGRPLWSYDGSFLQKAADTGGELAVLDGSLYVLRGALYRFDGSSLTQVNSTEFYTRDNPTLTVYDGALYFAAGTDSDGTELWQYDGSEVSQVKDINEGSSSSYPSDLAAADGALYFRAEGGSDGAELWQYDGSSVSQVQDINPGPSGSQPTDLTAFGNKLYFVANNGSDGWEPHAYTGGEYVNSLDFAPGGVSGGGFDPVVWDDGAGDKLYVTATDGTSGFEFYAIGPNDPLPVELADFEATLNAEEIHLTWRTASETNNAGFRIQRRVADASVPGPQKGKETNGREGAWTTVGTVEGSGTTSQAQSYRFTDAKPPYEADALTYRLKQVDTDGSVHYSKTITVERGVSEVQLLGTVPNPARQQVTVRFALPDPGSGAGTGPGSRPEQETIIRLYDVLGRQVRTVVSGAKEGRHEQMLDVSGLSSGVYFLRLRAGGETRTQKLTVVR